MIYDLEGLLASHISFMVSDLAVTLALYDRYQSFQSTQQLIASCGYQDPSPQSTLMEGVPLVCWGFSQASRFGLGPILVSKRASSEKLRNFPSYTCHP